MADKLNNLSDVYKKNIIDNEDLKKEWIQILQTDPNKAMTEYHNSLCKEQKDNGYCGLLQLFRILGALEEIKNQRDNPPNKQLLEDMNKNLSLAVPEEVKKLHTEHEKLKKEKYERDNKEKEDLEKINELNSVFKKLKKYIIDNTNYINQGYSGVNNNVREALEQFKKIGEELEGK